MINRFGIRNLKGLMWSDIKINPITILIGPNGTSKSTVAQGLLLLSQSRRGMELKPNGNKINLGNFVSLLLNQNPENDIGFLLEGSRNNTDFSYEIDFKMQNIDSASVKFTHPKYSFNFKQIIHYQQNTSSFEPPEIQFNEEKIRLNPGNEIGNLALFRPLTTKGDELREFCSSLAWLLNYELEHIYYIPPIRGTQNPFHDLQNEASVEPISLTGDSIGSINTQLLTTFSYNQGLLSKISDWCEYILSKMFFLNYKNSDLLFYFNH